MKYAKIRQNGQNWRGKCVLAILWLSVRCHPEGEYRPLFFHIAGLLRGQNQPVDQVTAAVLLKYGQNTLPMCDFEKSNVLHIFAHRVVQF